MTSREDLELYVMGTYDGDSAALEAELATDPAARAIVADEAELELLLRDAAVAATFCPACDDIVRGDSCASCGAAVRAGGYTIERVLVQNAHGRMYVARDADGTQVALKELAFVQAPNADAHAAFEREARMLRALEHSAIPRYVAAFEEGSGVHTRYYLAQELVAGEALDRRLLAHWFTEAEIADIARQVLRVLVYLQTLSPMVVHRDIKPANLVTRADGTITVVDFGAAHVGGATIGSTSIGTFGYMPVEQMAGIVDATTDTYALGASLLHLLTRREPWKLLQAPAWDDVNVSPAMRAYLKKLVAAEPRDRFASAQVALDALDRLGKDKLVITRTAIRHTPRILLAAAAILTVGGIGFASYRAGLRHAAPEQPAPNISTPTIDAREMKSDRHLSWGQPKLPAGEKVDLDYNEALGGGVLRTLGDACKLGLVIPDGIDFRVTAQTKQVPCDQALEVVLEAEGLWYRYSNDAPLIRIGARKQLDAEVEARLARSEVHDKLVALAPPNERAALTHRLEQPVFHGTPVDLDLERAPLRPLVELLANKGGLNVVLPDGIDGRVTVHVAGVAWDRVLDQVLQAEGLAYRYRPEGKLLRIATQKQLDAEDEAELARQRP
jgi:serine/threonine protein kinase